MGVPNTSYSFIIRREYPRLIKCDYFRPLITNLLSRSITKKGQKFAPFCVQLMELEESIDRLLIDTQPDLVIAERYQNRGIRSGGALNEIIPMIIGKICSRAIKFGAETDMITASTWKNSINRTLVNYTLNDIYNDAKQLKLPLHHVDSSLIGLYDRNKNYYINFNDRDFYERFLNRLSRRTKRNS